MKQGIHPEYGPSKIKCSCGHVVETQSTQPEIQVELCSACHPFYTGKQKIIDVAGPVERFQRRYGKKSAPAADQQADS